MFTSTVEVRNNLSCDHHLCHSVSRDLASDKRCVDSYVAISVQLVDQELIEYERDPVGAVDYAGGSVARDVGSV